jgi:hypothetical protein
MGLAELTEADILLAYGYSGRKGGVPYVFVDMEPTTEGDKRNDRFNDERIVAFIRFHNNLCLDEEAGGPRPEEPVNLGSENAIAWQRGKDRLVMINKSGENLPLHDLQTTLSLAATSKSTRVGCWRYEAIARLSSGSCLPKRQPCLCCKVEASVARDENQAVRRNTGSPGKTSKPYHCQQLATPDNRPDCLSRTHPHAKGTAYFDATAFLVLAREANAV